MSEPFEVSNPSLELLSRQNFLVEDGKIYITPKVKADLLLDIYPMPATRFININILSNHNESVILELFNAMGVTVETKIYPSGANVLDQLDISHLSRGIYTAKVSNSRLSKSMKLIIE
jgi:hypothetical protein